MLTMHGDIPVLSPDSMVQDPAAVEQIIRCRNVPGITHAAMMSDNHKGYGVPIGGVIASPTHIAPGGVGYDIGCGNYAVKTTLMLSDIQHDLGSIMDEIYERISFGVGRKNNEPADHRVLDDVRWKAHPLGQQAQSLAATQLGTVGSGNHYVDLLTDDSGYIWVGVHFGSRGVGHKTATYFLNAAGAVDNMDAAPTLIPVDSPLGQDYLTYMELAGDYAYAGREVVVKKVLSILGVGAVLHVHNHHNFAWLEEHGGEKLWVVRKGATPAFPGQLGFIGGSMGDICAIVEGRQSDLGPSLLYSTVHGAGRVMSRTAASGKTKLRKVWQCGMRDCGQTIPWQAPKPNAANPTCSACGGKMHRSEHEEVVSEGRINWAEVQGTLRSAGLELRGAGADEAPGCYKPLTEVLAAHAQTLTIKHTLTPIGVAMAGKDVKDPYAD